MLQLLLARRGKVFKSSPSDVSMIKFAASKSYVSGEPKAGIRSDKLWFRKSEQSAAIYHAHKSGSANPSALCDEMAHYVDKGRVVDVIYLDLLRLWRQSATAFLL